MKAGLKELLTKLTNTPIVVETGTNGIWTYRKWSDGTAEAFCKTLVSVNCNMSYGGIYYASYLTINFPTGLFTEAPKVASDIDLTGGIGGTTPTNISTSSMHLYVWNGTAFNYSGRNTYVYINAVGKWK